MKIIFILLTFLLSCQAPPPPTLSDVSSPHPEDTDNTCRVSGKSLTSALKVFRIKCDDYIASSTEAEKKHLLAEEMAKFLTTGVLFINLLNWYSLYIIKIPGF